MYPYEVIGRLRLHFFDILNFVTFSENVTFWIHMSIHTNRISLNIIKKQSNK